MYSQNLLTTFDHNFLHQNHNLDPFVVTLAHGIPGTTFSDSNILSWFNVRYSCMIFPLKQLN
jgi:hypothetical protein